MPLLTSQIYHVDIMTGCAVMMRCCRRNTGWWCWCYDDVVVETLDDDADVMMMLS